MKIFISHATADCELIRKLRDLLIRGTGIPHCDIFCSSTEGNIPNGAFFVQHILEQLAAADLIVLVLSQSFLNSEFCIAEAGAAQVRQLAKTATLYTLIVSPIDFPDLDGVLYGIQSGKILDPAALDGLRDRVVLAAYNPPATSSWNSRRDDFLHAAKIIVGEQGTTELLKKHFQVQDVIFERSERPDITYKSKVRVVLRNATNQELKVTGGKPLWQAGASRVRLQRPGGSSLQIEGPAGWESVSRSVYAYLGRFVSILLGAELRRKHEARRLGALNPTVEVFGYKIFLRFQL